MFTAASVARCLSELTTAKYFCVAYSGGMDSRVLLQTLVEWRQYNPAIELRAVHINHRLSVNADDWEKHCKKTCEGLNVSFIAQTVNVNAVMDNGVEAAARKSRYAAFADLLRPQEILLTAHTLNDQAETMLLQLLRGAGIKGLSAMPNKKHFACSYLLRPLLQFSTEVLKKYAVDNQLRWIEDDSNHDKRFNRNYLRHDIFPLLQRRWPQVFSVISRSAHHCSEAVTLLDELADMDLQVCRDQDSLLIAQLKELSDARRRNVLRRWITEAEFITPNCKHIQEIFNTVVDAAADAMPSFSWCGATIKRYQNKLYLLKQPMAQPQWLKNWDLSTPLILPNHLGQLQAQRVIGQGLSASLDLSKLIVRFRKGGERCHFKNRSGTHRLKKLWQEWRVPPWERGRIPLIFYGDELLMVLGYYLNSHYEAAHHEEGWSITWKKS